jgi:hypothetical protein
MHNIFRDEEKRIEHIAHSLKQVWRQVLSIKEDKKLNISSTAHLGVLDVFRGKEKAGHVQHNPL